MDRSWRIHLRRCDADLHDRLAGLVGRNDRSVAAIEKDLVLPEGTVFYAKPLSVQGLPRSKRTEVRRDWRGEALSRTAKADIVFLDPDNGFAGKSIKQQTARSNKYVFLCEVQAFLERGQSLVVYHHQTRRRGGLELEIAHWRSELNQIGVSDSHAIVFCKGSVRTYFVLPADRHRAVLLQRVAEFTSGLWRAHGCFSLFPGSPMSPSKSHAVIDASQHRK
jgi:hypothetical protein